MKNLQNTTNIYTVTKDFTVTNFDEKFTFKAGDELRAVTLCNDTYASCTRLADKQHAYVAFSKLYSNAVRKDKFATTEDDNDDQWFDDLDQCIYEMEARAKLKAHYNYDLVKSLKIERANKERLQEMLAEIE